MEFPGRTGFNGLLAGPLEPGQELRGAAEHKLLSLGAVVATPRSSVPLSPFFGGKRYTNTLNLNGALS